MRRRSSWIVALAAGSLALPMAASVMPASAAGNSKATVHGNAPAWATSSNLVGHASATQQLSIRVGLAPRDAAGAEAFAQAVSNPASSSYGHYLTPAQYAATYGPTASQTQAVKDFLSSAGLHVDRVLPSGDAVWATGTVKQVEAAFGTTLNLYRHNGKARRAPATPAQVPASLGNVVLSVGGLTDTTGAIHPNTKSPEGTQKPVQVATPCSTYYGENSVTGLPDYDGIGSSYPTSTCGYVPRQVRGAYGLQPGGQTGGSGVTVAIIDAYALPTMEKDANAYSANYGLPTVTGLYKEYPPAAFTLQDECGETGWWGEEALDVEAVHSMAPSAKIAYVPSASCDDTDFFDAYDRILTPTSGAKAPLATLVSNSYGDSSDELPDDLNNQTHQYFVQAASEGVGFYFSSGDDGDAAADNDGVPQPQASANDPLVTAVGGTTLGVTKTDAYGFETGWGNERSFLVQDAKTKQQSWAQPFTFYAGAGGGASAVWGEPAYQRGVVARDLTHPASKPDFTGRVVPDVAAVADPYTGFLVGYDDGTGYLEGSIGGTSLACPLFAGVMANAQAHVRRPIGFANPVLYRMSSRAFNDVSHPVTAAQRAVVYYSPGAKVTRLVLSDQDSSLATGQGYDNVTGLGSPSSSFVSTLVAALK